MSVIKGIYMARDIPGLFTFTSVNNCSLSKYIGHDFLAGIILSSLPSSSHDQLLYVHIIIIINTIIIIIIIIIITIIKP